MAKVWLLLIIVAGLVYFAKCPSLELCHCPADSYTTLVLTMLESPDFVMKQRLECSEEKSICSSLLNFPLFDDSPADVPLNSV